MLIKLRSFFSSSPVICLAVFSCFWLNPKPGEAQRRGRAASNEKTIMGIASWYNDNFHGRKTANGEVFNQKKLTCATNHFNLGSWLKVTNTRTGKSVIVRVNDRMHRNSKRIVDLTRAAAKKIGISKSGIIRVRVEKITKKK